MLGAGAQRKHTAVSVPRHALPVALRSRLRSGWSCGGERLWLNDGNPNSVSGVTPNKRPLLTAASRYALYGAAFGVCFPVGATLLDVLVQGLPLNFASVTAVQASQPLHWIIDTAPFFLGLMASFAGAAHDRLARFNSDLERRVAERTSEFTRLNDDLQAEILARERTETSLRHANDQALLAVSAKTEFLATISHEIRTPMNGVIGMTGLLLDTSLTAEQREYAQTVRNSAEALLTIVNDILDFSKIEAGRVDLEVIDFHLPTAIEETIDLVAHRAEEQGIDLAFLIHHDVPSQVRGDPGRLRQILLNLLSNAIKFTSDGEVVLSVSRMSAGDDIVALRFEVTDTGIGIPDNAIDSLFQPFSQVDASTTRRYGGTGLGLVISRQLCELMNGSIGVHSVAGEGSTFWFTVSLGQQPAGEVDLRPVSAEDMRGLHVLIVDDNDTNRRILVHHLQHWGFTYAEAASGPAALTALTESVDGPRPFSLVLMDFQMPDMDGEMLARRIRADGRFATLPLIVLTSLGARGEARRMADAGFGGYLVKPVKPSQLFDCIALVLGVRSKPVDDQAVEPTLVTHHVLAEAAPAARILVVEDNLVNQKVAVRMLQTAGYRCEVACNGLEAIDAVTSAPYDLVLMDCQMPEMDGLQATAAIRRLGSETAQQVPIVAMTANAMDSDRNACIEAGMNDYISKPVNRDVLVGVIKRWTVDSPGV